MAFIFFVCVKMYQGKLCLLVVILFLTFMPCRAAQTTCPCSYCGNNRANCARARYSSVPGPFPKDIEGIDMQNNQIQTITKESFGELPELKVLRLDQNNINDIRPGAFGMMPKLNDLVLVKNDIMALPDDLVHPDAPLENGIKLNHNGLTYFPLPLLMNTRKIINVGDNPINCDCYSVIPKDLKNKVFGHCLLPRRLRGKEISSITYEDVNCGVCKGVQCNHGSCYSFDGKSRKCLCEVNYYGDDCSKKNVNISTTKSTPPTTAKPTEKKKTLSSTSPPSLPSTKKTTNKTKPSTTSTTVSTTNKSSPTRQSSTSNHKSSTTTERPSSTVKIEVSTKPKSTSTPSKASTTTESSTSKIKLSTTPPPPVTKGEKSTAPKTTQETTKHTPSTTHQPKTTDDVNSSITPTKRNIVSPPRKFTPT